MRQVAYRRFFWSKFDDNDGASTAELSSSFPVTYTMYARLVHQTARDLEPKGQWGAALGGEERKKNSFHQALTSSAEKKSGVRSGLALCRRTASGEPQIS